MFSLCQGDFDIFQVGLISNVDDGDDWSSCNRPVETDHGDELSYQEGSGRTNQVGDRGPKIARAPSGPERLIHLATCI